MYSTSDANIYLANDQFHIRSQKNKGKQKLIHNRSRIKNNKRFPGISKVSQRYYFQESKRKKMLAKRILYSKRKKWDQKQLFYLKNNQHLIDDEEKVNSINSNNISNTTIKTKEEKKSKLLFGIQYSYLEKTPGTSLIKWFDSNNFKKVINRCIKENINIYGIEIFYVNENFMEVICQEEYDYDKTSSEPWFVNAFNTYSIRLNQKKTTALYSATYGF